MKVLALPHFPDPSQTQKASTRIHEAFEVMLGGAEASVWPVLTLSYQCLRMLGYAAIITNYLRQYACFVVARPALLAQGLLSTLGLTG